MLTQEYGTASNIKSRVNRLSVLGAITSTQQRLKLYTRGGSYLLVAVTMAVGLLCSLSLLYQCHRTGLWSTAAPF